MKIRSLIVGIAIAMLAGCGGMSNIKIGGGDGPVTGSAGTQGTQGAQNNIARCSAPKGVASLSSGSTGGAYSQIVVANYQMLAQHGLPGDPKPLLRVALHQTGCFTIVDRGVGLAGVEQERSLSERGMMANGQEKKPELVAADYVVVAEVAIPASSTGGVGAGLMSIGGLFGPVGIIAGAVAGSMKFSEAQVTIYVTDVRTGVQTAIVQGSAKSTDIGIGGALFGATSVGMGGWGNTQEGKLVAAAFVDAVNKLVPQL